MSIENERPGYPPKPIADCPVCGLKIYIRTSLDAKKHGVINEFMIFKKRKEMRLNYEREKEWERINEKVQLVSQKMKLHCKEDIKEEMFDPYIGKENHDGWVRANDDGW